MRFASHRSLVCCSVYCAWFLSLLLLGCGVNETTTPDEARYYPLPTEYHIQDEYFIVAHPDSKHPALGDAMEIVRRAIFEIYNPKLNSNSDPALSVDQPIVGCGGSTDPGSYRDDVSKTYCVRLPDPTKNITALLKNDQIHYIEAHGRVTLTGVQVCTPSWGLDQIDEPSLKARNDVYAYSKSGDNIDIFIFDTGISPNKRSSIDKDFYNDLGTGAWYDPAAPPISKFRPCMNSQCDDAVGHGTMMAGIAAGMRTGVAKKANLHPVKIAFTSDPKVSIDHKFFATQESLIKALRYFRDNSLWCEKPGVGRLRILLLPVTTEAGDGKTLKNAVMEVLDKCNALVVTGAGNDRADLDDPVVAMKNLYVPASIQHDGVITVAAYDEFGNFSRSFSNWGSAIDLLAPGVRINTIVPDAQRGSVTPTISGTSVAAAFVAGVAAQMVEANPGADLKAIRSLLLGSAIRNAVIDVPAGTRNLATRSPYGKGTTGDSDESDAIDGINDAMSLAACPEGSSCSLTGFCGGYLENPCNAGLQSPPMPLSECKRGVTCSAGICDSCGRKGEKCCDKGSQQKPSLQCADSLECNGFNRCTCGGIGETCCNGTSCKDGLGCDTDKKCKVCGLQAGQPCCSDGCKGDNLVCGKDSKCEACGADGLRCCAGLKCSGGPTGHLQCLQSTPSDPMDPAKMTCQACGRPELPCCGIPRDPCDRGSVCDSDKKICQTCGGPNEPCCTSSPGCAGSLQCLPTSDPSKKTCQACGRPGLPCCGTPRDPCDRGSVCGSDPMDATKKICQACGGPGEPCCRSGRACINTNHTCRTGRCGEWKSCELRCKNGSQRSLGLQLDKATCEKDGIGAKGQAECGVCGSSVIRVRYDSKLIWESNECGAKGVACCADPSDKNNPKANSCKINPATKKEFDCKPQIPPASCSTGTTDTCE